MTRVVIVEDHAVMRAVMHEFVDDLAGMEVVATAGSAEHALDVLEHMAPPDLLLVDVALPGMSGIELVRRVTDRWPEIRCVMLSGHVRPSYVERAFAAGAKGYLPKGKPEEVGHAIRCVLHGDVYRPD
jgi:DNA-binding NarL/FixJ family response regulator